MAGAPEDATELVSGAAMSIDLDRTRDRATDAEAAPLAPGTQLGRYVILEAIGRGGMGHVYAARDPELERRVAIKTLRRRSASQLGGEQVLLAEAQALAKLSHPNVVTVYDAGMHEDALFIAMEHIEGTTVQRWLEESSPPWTEVLDVFLRAGRGLSAAHRLGIVHRDFKPSNVMIDGGIDPAAGGRVRVVDFGLARTAERDAVRSSADSVDSSSGGSKSPRVVLGTPGFMAPEQMDNEQVDERSDQFSYCVSLWTALYGARPFAGTKVSELRRAILGRALREPSRAAGPGRIRRHLARGLDPDPDRRWPSMDALLERLESDRRIPQRRALAGLAAVAAVVLPTAGYLVATAAREPDVCPDASPQLGGVWDRTQADAVDSAFTATAKPFAEQVSETTRAHLDAWSDDWVRASHRACTAARVDAIETEAVYEQRARCLVSARTALAATVEVLLAADGEVVAGAVKIVSDLPSPTRCSDAELEATVGPSPEIAERVADLELELARVRALMRSTGYRDAARELGELDREAEDLGWAPLVADVEVAHGEALMHDKQLDEAEKELLEGLWTAMPIERDYTAAMAWTGLVRLAALRGKPDEAERYSRHAQAFLPRLHGAPMLEASLLSHRGLAAFVRADYDEAAELYRESLALMTDAYGEKSIHVAAAHNNIGSTHGMRGDHQAAVVEFERVLALTSELLGPVHPDTATALGNLAISTQKLGNVDEARALHRRVVEIRERALGPDHPDTGIAYSNLGALEQDEHHSEIAAELLARALEIKERSIGAAHPSTCLTRINFGLALVDTGHAAEALPELQRAHDDIVAALGSEHPSLFYARLGLGRALVQLDRAEEAVPLLEAAVAMSDASDPNARKEAEADLARAREAAKR